MAAETANALIGALSKVARYAVALGIGSSALQTSLYTGAFAFFSVVAPTPLSPPASALVVEALRRPQARASA